MRDPGKGQVLTQLAAFWFERVRDIVPNHLLTADFAQLPAELQAFPELAGRTTLCRRARVLPIECVVRGCIEGSGWKEYQATGAVCAATSCRPGYVAQPPARADFHPRHQGRAGRP